MHCVRENTQEKYQVKGWWTLPAQAGSGSHHGLYMLATAEPTDALWQSLSRMEGSLAFDMTPKIPSSSSTADR